MINCLVGYFVIKPYHIITIFKRRHGTVGSWVRAPSKAPIVSLTKKFYPYSLVLAGSRNGFERDFTIKLK